MARLSNLLFVALTVVVLISVSANDVIYTVTFVPCVEGSTCPQGNPSTYSSTFALNGTLSPNITLHVGDRLIFNLATTTTIHPLTICQNSGSPQFCQGAAAGDELSTPIAAAGSNATVTFTAVGTYYYGCPNHNGMGAIITVVQSSAD